LPDTHATSATTRNVLRLLGVALSLAVLTWLVYRPALNRVFVMDQVWYFAELDGRTGIGDGLRHYDYAATRQYWKGDDALFRPLLFAWLAVGNSLFSYHHVAWNIATLALHVLVAVALFQLLWTIRPSPFAYGFAALFAVLKPPLELVVWNHLGGYLLACLCLLIGLSAFVCLTRPGTSPSGSRWLTFAAGFAAAGFFHEAMVPIGVVAAVLVVWARRRTAARVTMAQALVLFAPALLFAISYAFHISRVARLTYVDRPDVHSLFDPNNLLAVIPRSLEVLAVWTREVALPTALRFEAAAFERLVKRFEFVWSARPEFVNLLVCAAGLVILVRALSRAQLRRLTPLLVLAPLALLAYAGVICLGRPQREVLDITYYLYTFGLLLLVFIYAMVDWEAVRGLARVAAGGVLVAFTLLHGTGTHSTARDIGRANEAASTWLTRVEQFVDQHRHEPDFTFSVTAHPRNADPEITLKEGYPDDPAGAERVKHLTEILFARYYRDVSPKYRFD
jgi:hypothetical protein